MLGDGAQIGDGAQLRESIVFPGTEIAAESILIGAIAGHGGILRACVGLRSPRAVGNAEARRSEPLPGCDVSA